MSALCPRVGLQAVCDLVPTVSVGDPEDGTMGQHMGTSDMWLEVRIFDFVPTLSIGDPIAGTDDVKNNPPGEPARRHP